LVAPAALVARKPDAVPWQTAAAFPVPALTADQALSEVVPAPSGESVLVHGAGDVTGGLLVQLAIMRGATVVATAGPGSVARFRGYGATAVFDYHDPGCACSRAGGIARWTRRRGRREHPPRRGGSSAP